MAIETTRWDAAEHLDTPQAIAAYVDAALEEGDPKLVAAALGDAARARGMTALARQTGLSRETFIERAHLMETRSLQRCSRFWRLSVCDWKPVR